MLLMSCLLFWPGHLKKLGLLSFNLVELIIYISARRTGIRENIGLSVRKWVK